MSDDTSEKVPEEESFCWKKWKRRRNARTIRVEKFTCAVAAVFVCLLAPMGTSAQALSSIPAETTSNAEPYSYSAEDYYDDELNDEKLFSDVVTSMMAWMERKKGEGGPQDENH
jgi:hypothetical protein